MKSVKWISLFLVLGLSAKAFADHTIICEYLFRPADAFSSSVLDFQNGALDTTSLRQEKKFVLKTSEVQILIENLKSTYGPQFKLRDLILDGTVNITSTKYMAIAHYYVGGKRLAAKVRFRKYYTKEYSTLTSEPGEMIPAEGFENKSWLEVKIQHPEHENVVIKPRLLINDADQIHFLSESFFDRKDGLKSRLLELNPGKEDDIEKFMNFFTQLNLTPSLMVKGLFANTQYERSSYSLKLKNPNDSTKKIDIQLTLDQKVRLTRLADKQEFDAYEKDETVVEVKIPVEFSKLSDDDITAVPGLSGIRDFIEALAISHLEKYPMNKGKMSKIEKKKGLDEDDTADIED